ncbi:hypothetical protein LB534_04990 [Mesorhizobium sp. CA18]|uniref:hypothetical protein n=1 Tax=unclassified Mesorhizobium TaxID=325217 RepID=UPI001CD03658|nr:MULTISPECIES: hypothetical protein [unclassified Mesorhizobium]MBZ9734351.1 hypothetical protein [Mesorhizobium sp. CA9]MBZ9824632.1 hypothetical protein [Mesorhizobium sp. CA18]MBZ9829410.1 hypothetical protein [Mesorhizobium sp. CA2]MBZ9878000.1 hypothetical protein [Mesorhizobium sp. Ca11]MBZ9902878.1 hypothetical protein [Mesorhizobium sp. CA17]
MAQVSFIMATKLIELLGSANGSGDLSVSVLSSNQLALGVDPLKPTSVLDLSNETVRSIDLEEAKKETASPEAVVPSLTHRASRQTGSYILKFKGVTTDCWSLRNLLEEGLKSFEAYQPGVLDKLSAIKPRTKRIVARDPLHLFDQAALAHKYAQPLMDGWWFGTNNSAEETQAWLRRGAELAGLRWGSDVSTSMPVDRFL